MIFLVIFWNYYCYTKFFSAPVIVSNDNDDDEFKSIIVGVFLLITTFHLTFVTTNKTMETATVYKYITRFQKQSLQQQESRLQTRKSRQNMSLEITWMSLEQETIFCQSNSPPTTGMTEGIQSIESFTSYTSWIKREGINDQILTKSRLQWLPLPYPLDER